MAARNSGTTCGATPERAATFARGHDLFAPPAWTGVRFPAFSLWQPYAQLPLDDAKPWETRSKRYPAKYHGQRIVVCSTASFPPRRLIPDATHELSVRLYGSDYRRTLPCGMALYHIVLKACRRTEEVAPFLSPNVLASGDFSAGRWAWEWGDVEPLNPFPVKGGQGWWFCDVPDGAFRCEYDAPQTTPPNLGDISREDPK